jgi:hypothetical protein
VDPGVDASAERLTRGLQLREGVVAVQQVGVLGDQVAALAIFTLDSDPPLDAGSAATQVWIVTP